MTDWLSRARARGSAGACGAPNHRWKHANAEPRLSATVLAFDGLGVQHGSSVHVFMGPTPQHRPAVTVSGHL